MDVREKSASFLENPFPLWENTLTELLVEDKINELRKKNIFSCVSDYTTAGIFLKEDRGCVVNREPIDISLSDNSGIHLELPSFDHLHVFYRKHGLNPASVGYLSDVNALTKLTDSLKFLNLVPACYACVTKTTKSIQVLTQNDPEIDISYSHPKIPFSIFISVGKENSDISLLRIAESILHESMHLKLTLIEGVTSLALPNSKATFFSPWRDEQRPVGGVLHGLFVFRAILDFYKDLCSLHQNRYILDFVRWRIKDIESELRQLRRFPSSTGLTKYGASLSANLLP